MYVIIFSPTLAGDMRFSFLNPKSPYQGNFLSFLSEN